MVRGCARMAESAIFEYLTLGVILLNALVLGLETYDRIAREAGGLLDAVNIGCVVYFVIEIAIRITAHGRRPLEFFKDGWNVFDFVVVAAAVFPGVRENTTLLRVVRLLRVFRVVSVLPEMRVLVQGLVRSLAPLVSMAVLALLLFYVYGMIGWIVFADHDPDHWGSIGQAMLTLFSVLTLEEWVAIQDTALDYSGWAWVYFVSFVLISSFLLLNMVIAVVISGVEEARAKVAEEDRRRARDVLLEAGGSRGRMLERLHGLREAVEALEEELAREGPPEPRPESAGR
jgi:voltage-gated sodium channel